MSSLAGAFLSAGASSVIATLWKVDDEASAFFFDQFYRALAAGSSRAAALREARLACIRHERWSSPRVWAAYTLIGEPD